MATLSSTLAWRIPRTEEPGGLQSMGSQRGGHDQEASPLACPEVSIPELSLRAVSLSTGINWMPRVPQCIQQATRPSLASSSSCHKPHCLSLSPRQQSTLHFYSASFPKSGSPNAGSYLSSESVPAHSAWMWPPGPINVLMLLLTI